MLLTLAFWHLTTGAVVLSPPEDLEDLSARTQQAYKLYQSGKLEDAVQEFRKQAGLGDTAALFALASLHESGDGVRRSTAEAKRLYAIAAKKGYVPAQYNLALLMMADPDEADAGLLWLKLSAESGSQKGMLSLGIELIEGKVADKDPLGAITWLERAAESQPGEPNYYLALLYEGGRGIDRDAKKALAHLEKAAAADFVVAMLHLASSYLTGSLGTQSTDKAMAIYKRGAGTLNSTACQSALGSLYEEGEALEQDYEKALFWYDKAAAGGMAEAYNKLGFFSERGMGVPKDDAKALEYYKMGAVKNVAVSMYNVAQMYDAGRGIDAPDEAEASKWMYKAAIAGMPLAQNELAIRYQRGRGVMQDVMAAAAWFERSAESGLAAARVNLAQLHEGKLGYPQDMQRAAKLYFSAASQGHPVAMFRLGQLYEEGIGTKPNLVIAYAFYLGAAKVGLKEAVARRDAIAKRLDKSQIAEAEKLLADGFKEPGGSAPEGNPPAGGGG